MLFSIIKNVMQILREHVNQNGLTGDIWTHIFLDCKVENLYVFFEDINDGKRTFSWIKIDSFHIYNYTTNNNNNTIKMMKILSYFNGKIEMTHYHEKKQLMDR